MAHPTEPAKTAPPPPLPETPQIWGGSRLHLVPWDTERVLAAWTLTHADIGWARQRDGGQLVLRLYLERGGKAEARDRVLDRWIGHELITVEQPVLGLTAAVGYLIDDAFVHIVRADPVQLPRGAPGPGTVRLSDGVNRVQGEANAAEVGPGQVSLIVDLPPLRGNRHQGARWVVDGLLPCLIMARQLADDGITGLGFAVSPLLLEQLAQTPLRQAILDVFDGRLVAVDDVARAPANSDHDRRLARQDRAALEAAQRLFRDSDGQLSAAFRGLAERGVEMLTGPASDALLHRLSRDPAAVGHQLQLAVEIHRAHLGHRPTGVLLTRSGFFNGLATALGHAGFGFALLDRDCLLHASTPPTAGAHGPIQSPDAEPLLYGAHRVAGDTEHPAYRQSGLRAARTVGEGPALSRRGDSGPYHLQEARAAADTAASALVTSIRDAARAGTGPRAHQVLVFDGGRLGTWFEASDFLAALARQLIAEPALELITVATHRGRDPVVQIAAPDAHYPVHREADREAVAPWLRPHLHLAAARLHAVESEAEGDETGALALAKGALVVAQGVISAPGSSSLVHSARAHLARCHELLDAVEAHRGGSPISASLLDEARGALGGFAGDTAAPSADAST